MGDVETLARERAGAQALLALLEQRFSAVQRKIYDRGAELARAIDDGASIAGGSELVELVGRRTAERSLRG